MEAGLGSAQFGEQEPPQQPGPQPPPPPRLTGAAPDSADPKAAKLEMRTLVWVDSQVGHTCLRSRFWYEVRTSNLPVQSSHEYS